jgi:hypothetical protein
LTPGVTALEADKYTRITQELLEAFPSQEDIDIVCKSDYKAVYFFYHAMTKEDKAPDLEAFDFVNNLAKIPDYSTHPVLVAKRMLILSAIFQCFPSHQTPRLMEEAHVAMKRLMDTAIKWITKNEDMVVCLEGIECIILEGMIQSNTGNLRRAWFAFRRAMITAQLMRMDRQDPPPIKILNPNSRMNPRLAWFRIVNMDRFLSLMLGLSQGSPNQKFDFEIPGETPTCKLERTHMMVAGKIIERNKNDPFLQDYTITQKLDVELMTVAQSMPDKFWLPPNFTNLKKNTGEAFVEQLRLADQTHHHNLVHLLHLPYLLRYDPDNTYQYSRTVCVNASREILTCFIAFRSFVSDTACCRTADFLALMAGMTILVAHIESRRQCSANYLGHQRVGDRALVEQSLESMELVSHQTGDKLTGMTLDVLRRLLHVEAEAVQGREHSVHSALSSLEEECSVLQLPIPYFGIIKIGREGISSKDLQKQQAYRVPDFNQIPTSVHVGNGAFSFGSEIVPQHPDVTLLDREQMQTQMEAQLAIDNDGIIQNPMLHPSLTAELTDWAFQGVDTAFFDSLMRGVEL